MRKPSKLLESGLAIAFTSVTVLLFIVGSNSRLGELAESYLASIMPSALVDLANLSRSNVKTPTLVVNPKLEEAARMKAQDMASKGYFAHYSPDGTSPWYWMSKAGYRYVYAGENLAVNFDNNEDVNSAWMNSPAHRANILSSRYKEIGIATSTGIYKGRQALFVVVMFGTPLSSLW